MYFVANISFMISVLIPVHNYLITTLVQSLHKQLTVEKIAFEIICLDDASTDKKFTKINKKIRELEGVKYNLLKTNIGRSAIRNKLAKIAQYEWLLFLDACPNWHQKFESPRGVLFHKYRVSSYS